MAKGAARKAAIEAAKAECAAIGRSIDTDARQPVPASDPRWVRLDAAYRLLNTLLGNDRVQFAAVVLAGTVAIFGPVLFAVVSFGGWR